LDQAQKDSLKIFDGKTLPALSATQAKLKVIKDNLSQEQAQA
jgi:hypothetical protein